MWGESEPFEVFSGLYQKRLNALYELVLKDEMFVKLRVSQTKIDAAILS